MSLEDFFVSDEPIKKTVEEERRLRIRLSIFAYAYEFMDTSLISDSEFDKMCLEVDLSIDTGNKKLDDFFKKEFNPSTGMWIRNHPEQLRLSEIYRRYYV